MQRGRRLNSNRGDPPAAGQPGDRACNTEAIGGAHYGPVQVYMASVADASAADGASSSWFKIFADTWAKNPSGGSGDDDNWGTKDINTCCGRMDVIVPSDLAPGDYLLRAEALALHTASSSGGAQFYVTCFQLSVTGNGSAKPAGVALPGAYKASDPGILVNIHAAMSGYTAPGPAVYAGGSTKSAGSACSGCASTCAAGKGPSSTAAGGSGGGSTVTLTSTAAQATPTSGSGAGCSVDIYGQCGGSGFSGCTTCGVSSLRAFAVYDNADRFRRAGLAKNSTSTTRSAAKKNISRVLLASFEVVTRMTTRPL